MKVIVNKVFKNSVDEDVYVISIKFDNDSVQNLTVTENEYKDLVAALRSITI